MAGSSLAEPQQHQRELLRRKLRVTGRGERLSQPNYCRTDWRRERHSGAEKSGSETQQNELETREKYFEETHPAGNVNGTDLSQEIETHREISTKHKPPS